MAEVRQELLAATKKQLIPLGVLDEFKSAGVFVNWWQGIRYDLKTIVSTGWHHTLIPDEYLIAAFFKGEATAIEALETKIVEAQSELAEAVESAQEIAAYEPEEDETATAAVIKKALKDAQYMAKVVRLVSLVKDAKDYELSPLGDVQIAPAHPRIPLRAPLFSRLPKSAESALLY